MPKRDIAYMQDQREQIAQAALECMIEQGAPETSLRDVCKRAGISIGALYVHFQTKEELILAACALDNEEYQFKPLPQTWSDFEAAIIKMFKHLRTQRQMRRMRLSLQFVADLAVTEDRPEGLLENYHVRLGSLRATVEQLHRNGAITAPMGVDATASALFDYFIGANYVMVTRDGAKPVRDFKQMFATMALIAGRTS